MKQQLKEQSSEKSFVCLCGKSYNRNSTLFNHIKFQHNNDKQYFLVSQSKVGRPTGLKNSCPRGQAIKKTPTKQIQCRCGDILKGEGAFYNHVNGKHKGDASYKQEKKQQGRKRKQCNEVSVSDEYETQTDFLSNEMTETQQKTEIEEYMTQNSDLNSAEEIQEEQFGSTTYFNEYEYNDSNSFTVDERQYQIYDNYSQMEVFDHLNIFEKKESSEQFNYNLQFNDQYYDNNNNYQQTQNLQDDDIISQYLIAQ